MRQPRDARGVFAGCGEMCTFVDHHRSRPPGGVGGCLVETKSFGTFAHVLQLRRSSNGKGQLPEWPNGADCNSADVRLRWFESITAHFLLRGSSSVDRALAFQAKGRGFEPRLPLKKMGLPNRLQSYSVRLCSSVVEHFLGKEEVPGSNPGTGSSKGLILERRCPLFVSLGVLSPRRKGEEEEKQR